MSEEKAKDVTTEHWTNSNAEKKVKKKKRKLGTEELTKDVCEKKTKGMSTEHCCSSESDEVKKKNRKTGAEERAKEVSEEKTTDITQHNSSSGIEEKRKKKKKQKPGIVYLSTVPPNMTCEQVRFYLSRFAEIGRIYLEPGDVKLGRKRFRNYKEGWVEFRSKNAAKLVSGFLNSRQVGDTAGSAHRDVLWSMKYLPRFKWAYLNEQLIYEKAVHSQRMRTEIAQAKRQTEFYKDAAEKSQRKEKLKKMAKFKPEREIAFNYKQIQPDQLDGEGGKTQSEVDLDDRIDLLKSVFSG